MIDEIYIKSSLQYKEKHVRGYAENSDNALASTVQSFMIKSAFGPFKEIIRLTPVNSSTGDQLFKMTNEVIEFILNQGFQVGAIIPDNNRINQNMFKLFAKTEFYFNNPSPKYSNCPIYLMFDTVHCFKNIRNNWVNLKKL